jgi:hypothetical protein
MRTWLLVAALVSAGTMFRPQEPARTDWVDADTGHRVVRLTDDAGGSTLYFHDNAFSPEGDTMMFNTPTASPSSPSRRSGRTARRPRS